MKQKWIKPKNIMSSTKRQTQESSFSMIPFIMSTETSKIDLWS